MTTKVCEECGAKAEYAILTNITKRYSINEDGDPNWHDGEVIANEEDVILVCNDCSYEYQC